MSVRVMEMLAPVRLGIRVTTVPPPTVVVEAAVPVGATSVEPPMMMVPPDGIGYGVPPTMAIGGYVAVTVTPTLGSLSAPPSSPSS